MRPSKSSAAPSTTLKRQQKQPPAHDVPAQPRAATRAASTRSLPWSLVISPTRSPRAARRSAAASSAVVLPAPRKPPTTARVGSIVLPFIQQSLGELAHHCIGRVEDIAQVVLHTLSQH